MAKTPKAPKPQPSADEPPVFAPEVPCASLYDDQGVLRPLPEPNHGAEMIDPNPQVATARPQRVIADQE